MSKIKEWLRPPAPVFLVLGFWIFLLSTTFADVFARMNISGEAFDVALSDSLYWSAVQWVGTIMLLAHMIEKMWTAAALSVGLLPFRAIPLVALGFLLRWLVFRLFSGQRLPS